MRSREFNLCIDCFCYNLAKYTVRGKQYLRNRCKSCHSTFNSNRELERKLELMPDRYKDCNCGKIYKITKTRDCCKSCSKGSGE